MLRLLRRRILRLARRSIGSPDAWGDVIDLLRAAPSLTYLDVGAHIGLTVERITDECQNRIVAFEPTAASRAALDARVSRHPQVETLPFALSDQVGQATLHCNANAQTNSLLENDQGNLSSFPDDVRHTGTETIDTTTLDAWAARRPSTERFFLKLDVQGAELKVLHGAISTLPRIAAIYAECPLAPMYRGQGEFWDIHRFLQSHGFHLAEIYPCFKNPQGHATQTDALWLR